MNLKKKNIKIDIRHLIIASVILTFVVIVLGVMTRVTAGNGCPDWPTCDGSWIVSIQNNANYEYFHRAASVLAGILILATVGWAWRKHQNSHLLFIPLVLSAFAFILEIFFSAAGKTGSLSFRFENSLHQGLALLIFGFQLMALSAAYQDSIPKRLRFQSSFGRLSLITLLAVFVLLISGTIVSITGASEACEGWPLCIPQDVIGWLSLVHRFLVGITTILAVLLLMKAWQTQRSQPAILVSATTMAVLLVAQALLGAVDVAQDFPPHLLALHIATSVGVFGTAVLSVVFTGLAKRNPEEEDLERIEWGLRSKRNMLRDLLMLTKPIVVSLLLVTTYAGMVIGAKAWPSFQLAFWTLLGGFMAAGGAGAINQFIDRNDDNRMQRTQNRPIPSGRLTPAEGLAFGIAISIISFYIMVAFVNMLAALLTLAGLIYYVVLYSVFLKKITVQNIVIGGGAGAIPPLVGWAAATGSLNIPSLLLFAIIFMWTPPHFWALAIVRQKDYARAGVPMLPVVRGESETRRQIFIYTTELVALTLFIPLFGLGGSVYLILAFVLGLWLLVAAWNVWKNEGNKVAWKMYRYSSMYLAFIFAALMFDALL